MLAACFRTLPYCRAQALPRAVRGSSKSAAGTPRGRLEGRQAARTRGRKPQEETAHHASAPQERRMHGQAHDDTSHVREDDCCHRCGGRNRRHQHRAGRLQDSRLAGLQEGVPGRAAHGVRGLRLRCPPYRTQSCSRNFQAGFTSMRTPSSWISPSSSFVTITSLRAESST